MSTSVFLRRKKLGKTSTEGIAANMEEAVVIRNWLDDPWPDKVDYVFRWGCTSNLPRKLNVINQASAIHLAGNKKLFRGLMAQRSPEITPRTWFSAVDAADSFSYPDVGTVIVRPATHSQGRDLWVFELGDDGEDEDNLFEKCEELGEGNYYISELINKVAEYRVFVCSGRAVWVARKTPGNPEDIAWNVAQGGRFDNVRWGEWPLSAVRASIEAFNHSGLDFGGVDVIIDEDGRPFIIEINSAPSQTSPYRQECVAKAFSWIVNNGRDHIPVGPEGKYLPLIHPSLDNKAV